MTLTRPICSVIYPFTKWHIHVHLNTGIHKTAFSVVCIGMEHDTQSGRGSQKPARDTFKCSSQIKIGIYWVEETSYLFVSGLYMCTKSYSKRFLYLSLHFFIKLYRVLILPLYEAIPPCDTQLPQLYVAFCKERAVIMLFQLTPNPISSL